MYTYRYKRSVPFCSFLFLCICNFSTVTQSFVKALIICLGTVHIVGFGLPYLGFGQCVKKVVVGHLVNSQPVVEDEKTFYTTEY